MCGGGSPSSPPPAPVPEKKAEYMQQAQSQEKDRAAKARASADTFLTSPERTKSILGQTDGELSSLDQANVKKKTLLGQ